MEVLKGDLVVTNRQLIFKSDDKLGGHIVASDLRFGGSGEILRQNVGIVLNDHVGNVKDMALVLIDYKVLAMWKHYLNVLRKFND